jgi:small subunit ribosomal protein S6
MPLYECVFIARQDISATQVESLVGQFSGIIEENGGKVAGSEMWGLRNPNMTAADALAAVNLVQHK